MDAYQQQVAQTILEQMGGNRFVVMTGAKNLMALSEQRGGLSFKLPSTPGFVKEGINLVKIVLTGMDDYIVTFGKARGTKYTVISTHEDIYCDQLQELFTRKTGLYTNL